MSSAAESLSPGTDAILKGTVEMDRYRLGWLVRYRRLDGYVMKQYFRDVALAHAFFKECVEKLQAEVRPL
jgi:hypothetical protein